MSSRHVWIIMKYDAEPYESFHDGVHKVFNCKTAAEDYLSEVGVGPHNTSREAWDEGYLLSKRILKFEVNG